MSRLNFQKAVTDLSECATVWNKLYTANIDDLKLNSYTLNQHSFNIIVTAGEWHTVTRIMQVLRKANLLIPKMKYHLVQRPTERRRKAAADIVLPNGKITIYSKGDCFGNGKDEAVEYNGYTNEPACSVYDYKD